MIEINECIGGPDSLLQFVAADDFARSLQQDFQNLQWLLLQLDLHSLPAKLSGVEVGFKLAFDLLNLPWPNPAKKSV